MPMKSGAEFLQDLQSMSPTIYSNGEKVSDFLRHPLLQPVINTAKATYDLALEQESSGLMSSFSSLTNEPCNLLSALFQEKQDLIKTVKLRRWWQNQVGSCSAGRCAGTCVANAIYHGTYVLDQELGTDYHQRFREFYQKVQQKDQLCAAGVMCVKGDRSKGPTGQQDPDLYLRLVRKDSRGIVVRGAKAHQSNGALAHEILVIPLRPMGPEEKDYALAFAVQNGTEGLIHVWQHNLHDSRRMLATGMDLGSRDFGLEYHGTCLSIFNDVFIPWERVFMCGEHSHSTQFVDKFADLIRMCGGGCRSGAVDLALGAMGLVADYNGIEDAAHIKDKLTNISQMSEAGYGCALAAAYEGQKEASGLTLPNSLYANTARLQGTYAFAEANKWLGDVAGGLIATLPAEADFQNQEIGSLLGKYLVGRPGVSAQDRAKALRFAEMLGSGPVLHGLMCGGGTPETQKMTIRRNLDLEQNKEIVKRLAGI